MNEITIIPKATTSGNLEATLSKAPLQRAFDLCVRKTRTNIADLARQPASWSNAVDGDYSKWNESFFEIGNWTSSFFAGMALLAWNETEDEYFLQQVLKLSPAYREKVFNRFEDTHHDLGFLYTLYSVALFKLTKDGAHWEVGVRAAEMLHRRFNANGGFIRAWGHLNTAEHENMAIIDCMMNLPLLFWASAEGGEAEFRAAAVRHADTTLKYFVRADDSVYHAYRFDLKSGGALGADNFCGRFVESYWARGAAWAIYGFALSYAYTGDLKYLDAAARLARKFNQELDDKCIPVWDFRLPPGEPRLRDSSAAAVAVCGFQQLEKLGAADSGILRTKQNLLRHLCSEAYLNFDETCRGILKEGQVGSNGPGSAQNAYTSWGDYFLMEALSRELFGSEVWW